MFSKKPVNRKRNRRRSPRSSSRSPRSRADSVESLREKEFQLNAQIGELEKALAHHDEAEAMRHENILPPLSYGTAHSEFQRKLSYAERRLQNHERNKSLLYFLLLLAIASGLAFWLFYTGG